MLKTIPIELCSSLYSLQFEESIRYVFPVEPKTALELFADNDNLDFLTEGFRSHNFE